MSIGQLYYSYGRKIVWDISEVENLDFPQSEDSRIWSPSFHYFHLPKTDDDIAFHFEVPEDWIGLILITNLVKCPKSWNSKMYRIGMVHMGNELGKCDAKFFQRNENTGYFGVKKFVNETEVKVGWSPQSCQLFVDLIKQDHQLVNAFTQTVTECVRIVTKNAVDDNECNDTLLKSCSSKSDDINRQEIKNLVKLSQNLMDVYVEGKDSDLTIKVKDREFKAHKVILRARSSVFDAMFAHDLSESNSGVVPIEDCEPGIFEEFLYFVYAGKTRHLSSDNMCELYYVADKYDLTELKEECVSFLQKSLSIETICDVICLSTKHTETELLEHATVFFAKNMDDILVTNKWQLFLKDNPIIANELSIKGLKLGFIKRKN